MYYFIDDLTDIEKNVIDALCVTLIPYLIVKKVTLFDEEGKLFYEN
jgi:hypothetical protein